MTKKVRRYQIRCPGSYANGATPTAELRADMQNTMQFINALQKAQKDFELMIYPGARHGLQRHQYPHLRRMQWRAIRQKLLDRD